MVFIVVIGDSYADCANDDADCFADDADRLMALVITMR